MIANLLLIALIFGLGFLVRVPKNRRFSLAKSFFLVLFETVAAMIFSVLILALMVVIFPADLLVGGVGSFFSLILSVAILSGVILFWLKKILSKKIKIDAHILTLSEYIIQWSLIYITVYQIIFENIFANSTKNPLEQIGLSTPSGVMIMILPSLISVWISVILTKIRNREI